MKSFAWLLFFVALVLLSVLPAMREQAISERIIQRAQIAETEIDTSLTQRHEQNGTVHSVNIDWQFSTGQLQGIVRKMPAAKQHYYYTWSQDNLREVTGSASGVDKNTWFANSYLVGFKPFDTDNIWEPLATLALRKGYILDHDLYGLGMSEIWQNSKQGFLYSRGDCEDHAIVLADWLIALGHDARVVLGKHKSEGHAWVVLLKNGKEYILEATSKRRPGSINDFQLAALATDYRPMYQFNRDEFWVNSGSPFTTRYSGEKWQLRSRFVRGS